MAYDHLSGNLYVADSGTKRIEVFKHDGSMRAVVVSKGLNNPRGIAVDPVGGFVDFFFLKLNLYMLRVMNIQ